MNHDNNGGLTHLNAEECSPITVLSEWKYFSSRLSAFGVTQNSVNVTANEIAFSSKFNGKNTYNETELPLESVSEVSVFEKVSLFNIILMGILIGVFGLFAVFAALYDISSTLSSVENIVAIILSILIVAILVLPAGRFNAHHWTLQIKTDKAIYELSAKASDMETLFTLQDAVQNNSATTNIVRKKSKMKAIGIVVFAICIVAPTLFAISESEEDVFLQENIAPEVSSDNSIMPEKNMESEHITSDEIISESPAENVDVADTSAVLNDNTALQAKPDGTGIEFSLPLKWGSYPSATKQNLHAIINNAGNKLIYGLLHGFMEAEPLVISVSIQDSSDLGVKHAVEFEVSYDIALANQQSVLFVCTVLGWETAEPEQMYFENAPASAIIYINPESDTNSITYSLECNEGVGYCDWIYYEDDEFKTSYYSIADDKVHEYVYEEPDDYSDMLDTEPEDFTRDDEDNRGAEDLEPEINSNIIKWTDEIGVYNTNPDLLVRFQQTAHDYIDSHIFSTAFTNDLFNSIRNTVFFGRGISSEPVSRIAIGVAFGGWYWSGEPVFLYQELVTFEQDYSVKIRWDVTLEQNGDGDYLLDTMTVRTMDRVVVFVDDPNTQTPMQYEWNGDHLTSLQ